MKVNLKLSVARLEIRGETGHKKDSLGEPFRKPFQRLSRFLVARWPRYFYITTSENKIQDKTPKEADFYWSLFRPC